MKRSATPAPTEATGLSRSDWDDLFRAVCDRLRHTVAPATPPIQPGSASAQDLRDSVLDCVAALEQLHRSLPAPHEPEQHEASRGASDAV